MAIGTTARIAGIKDAKAALITADTGSELTYGSFVDLPGVQSLEYKPRINSVEVKGDGEVVRAIWAKQEAVELNITMNNLDLTTLSNLMYDTLAASGSGVNEKQTLSIAHASLPKSFKLEGQAEFIDSNSGDITDAHFVFYKCKVVDISNVNLGGDFAAVNLSCIAIAAIYDDSIADVVFNETEAAIA